MELSVLKKYSIIPFLSILLVFLLTLLGTFEYLEYKTIDLRFKLRGSKELKQSEIVIIAIDEQSYESLPHQYPFPRSYYAKLVENLKEAGARQIIFDIEFTKPGQQTMTDSLFAQAVINAGNVIFSGTIIRDVNRGYHYYEPPIEVLQEQADATGIVNDVHDSDGFTRRYNIFLPCQGKVYYSLGVVAYMLKNQISIQHSIYRKMGDYCNIADTLFNESIQIPTVRSGFGQEQTFYINYFGPAGSFPYYSFSQVMDDADFQLNSQYDNDYMEIWRHNSIFPDELRIQFLSDNNREAAQTAIQQNQSPEPFIQRENPFNDKIVMIGSSLAELHDDRLTPFYHYNGEKRLMPGVEVHAHALQTMLDEAYIQKVSLLTVFITWVLVNSLTGIFVHRFHPGLGALIGIGILVAVFFFTTLLFSRFNLLFPLVNTSFSIVITYFGIVGNDFFRESREKRKIRKMFQTYTSPKVLKYLEENPDSFSLQGERREATIFFSDIAGFTSISEKISAEQLSALLNQYLTPMTDILMKYNGYVDKYEGDAIMCNFGVPIQDDQHALNACYAALEQQQKLKELRMLFRQRYGVHLSVRIGINTGIVSAGNMGSEKRFQYTVLGDAVNQASRFEGANKIYGTQIMIGETTYQKVKTNIAARLLDKIVVKGKKKAVMVYNPISTMNQMTPKIRKIINFYNSGMAAYFSRDWRGAIEYFNQILTLRSDEATRTMILRCKKYMNNPPPEKWQGELRLLSK